MNMTFLVFYNVIGQYLKEPENLSEPLFSQWPMHDVTKSSWVKDPFKEGDCPVDFTVTEYKKFTDMSLDFTLQLSFKKPPLLEFGCGIKEEYPHSSEKPIKIFLIRPFSNYLSVWDPIFFIH